MDVSRPTVRIVSAQRDARLVFLVDAVVVEDDTHMVLGAERVARETYDPPRELLEQARASIEPAPGTLVVRAGRPLGFHAIVHDLSREPSWSEAWVANALAVVFREVEVRGLHSVSLPTLGGVHGSLAAERFAELLASALAGVTAEQVEEVWLTVAPAAARQIAAVLRERGLQVREEGPE